MLIASAAGSICPPDMMVALLEQSGDPGVWSDVIARLRLNGRWPRSLADSSGRERYAIAMRQRIARPSENAMLRENACCM